MKDSGIVNALGRQTGATTGWRVRFAWLARESATADPADAAALLRLAAKLLVDVPLDWRAMIAQPIDEPGFEALLAADGADAAALVLLGDWAGYMLSHGPGGRHLATVVIEGRSAEASVEGESAALALLGALASAISGEDPGEGRKAIPAVRDHGVRLN